MVSWPPPLQHHNAAEQEPMGGPRLLTQLTRLPLDPCGTAVSAARTQARRPCHTQSLTALRDKLGGQVTDQPRLFRCETRTIRLARVHIGGRHTDETDDYTRKRALARSTQHQRTCSARLGAVSSALLPPVIGMSTGELISKAYECQSVSPKDHCRPSHSDIYIAGLDNVFVDSGVPSCGSAGHPKAPDASRKLEDNSKDRNSYS